MSEKQQFIQTWEEEFKRTVKVLKSYPPDKLDVKPAPGFRTAREVMEVLVGSEKYIDEAVSGQLKFEGPKMTDSLDEYVKTYEKMHRDEIPRVEKVSDDQYAKPIKFFVGPRKPGDVPLSKVLWFILHDHIHHRGQLTVLLRMAGGSFRRSTDPRRMSPGCSRAFQDLQ